MNKQKIVNNLAIFGMKDTHNDIRVIELLLLFTLELFGKTDLESKEHVVSGFKRIMDGNRTV